MIKAPKHQKRIKMNMLYTKLIKATFRTMFVPSTNKFKLQKLKGKKQKDQKIIRKTPKKGEKKEEQTVK